MAQRKKALPCWLRNFASNKSSKDSVSKIGSLSSEDTVSASIQTFNTNDTTVLTFVASVSGTINTLKDKRKSGDKMSSEVLSQDKSKTQTNEVKLIKTEISVPDDFELFQRVSNTPMLKIMDKHLEGARSISAYHRGTSTLVSSANDTRNNNDNSVYEKNITHINNYSNLGPNISSRSSISQSSRWNPMKEKNETVSETANTDRDADYSASNYHLQRNPSIPQVTSSRRDQSRASFRSKSVRDRGHTKKLSTSVLPKYREIDINAAETQLQNCVTENLNTFNRIESLKTHDPNLCRVRSFKRTNKGLVNLGDAVRARSVTTLPTDFDLTFKGLMSICPLGNEYFPNQRLLTVDTTDPLNKYSGTNKPKYANLNKDDTLTNPTTDVRCPGIMLPSEEECCDKSCSQSTVDYPPIRIQVIGAPNVGKTALCRQLITSEFLGARMESISEDTTERYVTVELDKQTWNLVLIDNFGEAGLEELTLVSNTKAKCQSTSIQTDPNTIQLLPTSKSAGGIILKDVLVYIIVYAIDDTKSYDYISTVLRSLFSKEMNLGEKIVILVANKSDLVRSRTVSTEKGKRLAHLYGCKYFEISTAINHLVDELLVEIVVQITRLRNKTLNIDSNQQLQERRVSSFKSSGEAIVRFICRQFIAKSCESLHKS